MPQAIFTTPHGQIRCELFASTAPKTVENFIKLANEGFYNDLAFHRVIANFMIQGGCPHSREGDPGRPGTGGPGYHIPCELGAGNPERHLPGTLSMAHAGRDTGGSQFFITHVATPHLDDEHTVFGRVLDEEDLKVVWEVAQGDRFSVTIAE
ncbi:MAG: peptidylprolyl isomerase [Planctomycetota bacterium]|nr:MAG: peptidylprolyl isomerase [Planctomycetota bacterium]